MRNELKPVPCGCGGEVKAWEFMNGRWYVKCQKCAIGQMFAYRTEAEAVTAWNRAMGERTTMVWKPAEGRPAYEKGICSCGYVLSVLQRDFVYCPMCGCRLEWNED